MCCGTCWATKCVVGSVGPLNVFVCCIETLPVHVVCCVFKRYVCWVTLGALWGVLDHTKCPV